MVTAVGTEPGVAGVEPIDHDGSVGPCTDPLGRGVLAGIGALFLALTFAQAPGLIIDDTKLPVIMAPLQWMKSALHLWSLSVASGSVQDQTFGYFFPMAPFFELMHLLHIPVWCAERIWLALLLTAGAWGVVRLAEAMGIGTRWARVLAGLAYCIAPIVVDWAAISATLLAVVLLPWVLVPLVRGSRDGSPRMAAARSGVAVALMGGVNATVVLSTLPLAVIWLITRSPGPRRRALSGWWVVSVGLACFWWAVPTILQGKYGYNYLPYTETAATTTATASAFEAVRGASYWQNYYDLGGPLVPGGWTIVTSGFAILGTALVAALGLAGLARRIPERLFLVASLAVGVVVIASGYSGPFGGPVSGTIVQLLTTTLAPLRNISKFSADVALPLALGLAWFVSSVRRPTFVARLPHWLDRRWIRPAVGAVAVLAVVAASMPFWLGELYPPGGFRAIPTYWQQTADWLTAHQGNQTSLLVPGAPFAQYTWGSPGDEPLAVLASTSVTARSIIPLGSDGNTVMLSTVEDVLASGTPQPGLASFLGRSGIDFVVERNDLNLVSTAAIPPAQVHQVLSQTPGLVRVAAFGPFIPKSQATQGKLPNYDSPASVHLRSVEIWQVTPAVAEVQTFPTSNPLVVSGSSGSLLPLSGSGVLQDRAAVLATDAGATAASRGSGATLALTDGNQRRAVSFGKIDRNTSYLLAPGQRFGRSGSLPLDYGSIEKGADQTVALPIGGAQVTSSSYGSTPLLDIPSEGPASAFDGDPGTAWVASLAAHSVGQWIAIRFGHPVSLHTIAITPLDDTTYRPWIKEVRITTDRGVVTRAIPKGGAPVTVAVAPGETSQLTIRIVEVWKSPTHFLEGAGITDVAIPGVTFHPAMRLPTAGLARFADSDANPPILSLSDPVDNPNLDFTGPTTPTPPIDRIFTLPKATILAISGTAVPVPGAALEQILSTTATPVDQDVQITASSWLRDLPRYRPENLVEVSHSPWIAGLDDPHPTLTLRWAGPKSVASIDLGLYPSASRPTRVTISSPVGTRTVPVPRQGGIVRFAPMTTDTLTVRFTASARVKTISPVGPSAVGVVDLEINVPVGLSSISVPALGSVRSVPPSPSTPVTLACGSGPGVEVDGVTVPTSSSGTLANLINLQPMAFRGCPSTAVSLSAGRHVMSFPSGSALRMTVLLADDPVASGGTAAGPTTTTAVAAPRSTRVEDWAPARRAVDVGPGASAYLQVSQNFNPGWTASMDGRTLHPVQLDGWQQGWIVPAGAGGTVTMIFAPDQDYRLALAVGAFLLLLLFCFALFGRQRSEYDAVGPRARLPVTLLAAVAFVVTLMIGGVVMAVFLVPLLYVARRWGSDVIAAVAGVSFIAAGVIVALNPNTVPGFHLGVFSASVQFLAVVAIAAVLCTVVVDGRELTTKGGRRGSGGDDGP